MMDKTMETKQNDSTENESTPLDELASLLDSYSANPKLATPETLAKAAQMARDIRDGVESEDEGEDEGPNPYDKMGKEEGGKGVTIGIMLGKMKKGGK